MGRASEDDVADLHSILVAEFTRRLKSGEVSATDLNVIRQFLKDNSITCTENTPEMEDLLNSIPDSVGLNSFKI